MQGKIDQFIERWQDQVGGQERANYAMFLIELCQLLGVPSPDAASAQHDLNDYVFERVVRETTRDGTATLKRIDLYKRNCFVLEAKQSRLPGEKKDIDAPQLPGLEPVQRGRRSSANRSWDVLMVNARAQAENYVRLLPASHEPPPFVLVCDVGTASRSTPIFAATGRRMTSSRTAGPSASIWKICGMRMCGSASSRSGRTRSRSIRPVMRPR